MPPKAALRRPAGAGPIGHRAVRGGAGAQALARAKAGVRRPASAAEETPGVEGDSESFQRGEAVEAYKLPLETWKSGTHIAITKGIYWEEEVQVAGRVEGLATKKDQVTLSFRLEGTKNESLVKWSGSHPGVALEVDICQPGCGLISKDGLLHCRVVQKVLDSTRAAWMNNLVAAETPMGAEDELRRLRLREKEFCQAEEDRGRQRSWGASRGHLVRKLRRRKEEAEEKEEEGQGEGCRDEEPGSPLCHNRSRPKAGGAEESQEKSKAPYKEEKQEGVNGLVRELVGDIRYRQLRGRRRSAIRRRSSSKKGMEEEPGGIDVEYIGADAAGGGHHVRPDVGPGP